MSNNRRYPRNRQSLLTADESYEDPLENAGCCKTTTIIISVLFFCGVAALGLSVVGMLVVEGVDVESEITTSTVPTSDSLDGFIQKYSTHAFTTSSTSSDSSSTESSTCKKQIIGLFTEIEFSPITRIQLRKLTHAVFAYLQMNSDGSLRFKNDRIQNRFLDLRKKAKGLTSHNVKVVISIGGPDNSNHFSGVVADLDKRNVFIESIVSFLKEHDINGVNLFWKWPKEYEQSGYTKLLEELGRKMKELKQESVLSITAPPAGIDNWEYGFDLNGILKHVDFINVLTMDYYGPWPNQWGTPTGPTSPLYSGFREKANFNVDYTMRYFSCETSQPSKLNIVVPFYARLWRNVLEPLNSNESQVFRKVELKNEEAQGQAYMSRWTVEHEKWKTANATWDEETRSSYIYDEKSQTFLTFETEESIAAKMDYVRSKNLGGVWIWSVDQDDSKNRLLEAVDSHDLCSNRDVDRDAMEYDC